MPARRIVAAAFAALAGSWALLRELYVIRRSAQTDLTSSPIHYLGSGMRFAAAPDFVCTPESETDVARALEACAAEKIAVTPYGGGTSVVGGVEAGGRFDGYVQPRLLQGDRIELRAPRAYHEVYQLGPDGQRRPLPAGATWDALSGILYWQPAPGFLGRYRVVFSNGSQQIRVRVVVVP